MKVAIAYGFVVLVWSTTPIAVKLSNSSLSFIAAVSLRMVIALAICCAILAILRRPLVKSKKDWVTFFAAALGLFPTMAMVYWSAQFIPSGLISVMFGLSPFIIGFFSLFLLDENMFNGQRIVALMLAVVGLIIINGEQLLQGTTALFGVLVLLLAVGLFGLNSVWLKAVGSDVDPLRQLTGALLVATPGFLVTWYFLDGTLPTNVSMQSSMAVGYLSIAGSVLGHTAFFYVVQRCSIASAGLITLISPVLAMAISIYLAKEHFSDWTMVGAGLVIISLAVYQGVGAKLTRSLQKKLSVKELEEDRAAPDSV